MCACTDVYCVQYMGGSAIYGNVHVCKRWVTLVALHSVQQVSSDGAREGSVLSQGLEECSEEDGGVRLPPEPHD